MPILKGSMRSFDEILKERWTMLKWKKTKADSQSKIWLVRLSFTQQELEHDDAKKTNFSS